MSVVGREKDCDCLGVEVGSLVGAEVVVGVGGAVVLVVGPQLGCAEEVTQKG